MTAESFQHRQYMKATSLKFLPMRSGKLVVVIEEKHVLEALDVGNSSRGGARDANDVGDVSV